MNNYIHAQILQMTAYAKSWEQACYLAAQKNDGVIDKEEERQLRKISAAVKHFTQKLDAIPR